MIFKDRRDAGRQLSAVLSGDKDLLAHKTDMTVVSLLRGGWVIGDAVAKELNVVNIPLVVIKIPAPGNPELAIGALCFHIVYLNNKVISDLELNEQEVEQQIKLSQNKHKEYLIRFKLQKINYDSMLRNKTVILTDDGAATGSSIKAALLFIRSKSPKKIILALPVAPEDFHIPEFDKTYILHRDPEFSSVSRFYEEFAQVETIS